MSATGWATPFFILLTQWRANIVIQLYPGRSVVDYSGKECYEVRTGRAEQGMVGCTGRYWV